MLFEIYTDISRAQYFKMVLFSLKTAQLSELPLTPDSQTAN